MNAEEKLVKELKDNEHIIQIVSYDDLINEWNATKPYLKEAAGLVSPARDLRDAKRIINEFGYKTNKVLIKEYAGKKYVIFKGYPGTRKIFRGTRYLVENPKVVRMAVGPKGVADSVKVGFVITAVLSVGIDVFDYVIRDKATLPELFGTVSGDLIKIGLSAIAAGVAAAAVGTFTVLGSAAAAPLLVAIVVGYVVGKILDKIDSKIGATAALIKAYEKLGIKLREIEYEAGWWYNYFENHPSEIMRLFGGPSGPYLYGNGY